MRIEGRGRFDSLSEHEELLVSEELTDWETLAFWSIGFVAGVITVLLIGVWLKELEDRRG